MRKNLLLASLAVLALVAVSFLSTPAARGASAAENYGVDPVHSTLIFRIKHMGVANFYGRFNEISGTFTRDDEAPANNAFAITVKTGSVDSGNDGRNRHLVGTDFFNAREYPEITFKSTSVEAAGDGKLKVTGDLSLHGVTKSVTADVQWIGRGETPQGYKCGFDVTFKFKRSDFGMTTYIQGDGLGDEVLIMLGVEGRKAE